MTDLKEIQTEMAPRFSAHNDNILLNAELFARVAGLYESRDSLGFDAESRRLLERYHTDFVRSGAQLSEEEKIRLRVRSMRNSPNSARRLARTY